MVQSKVKHGSVRSSYVSLHALPVLDFLLGLVLLKASSSLAPRCQSQAAAAAVLAVYFDSTCYELVPYHMRSRWLSQYSEGLPL